MVVCAAVAGHLAAAAPTAEFAGTVRDGNAQTVIQVSLTLKNKFFEKSVTVDGDFSLSNLPAGNYSITLSAPGFATLEETLELVGGELAERDFVLQPQTIALEDVVMAPSTFSIMSQPVQGGNYLDRETIRNTPHFGDDVYRALATLPGTSSTDFSASFNLRGGEYREVKVTFDDMELHNPFHLKDYTGVFSFIDPEALGGLTLTSGGHSAKYGNARGGVLVMDPLVPSERKTEVTLSFGNVGLRSEGTFNDGLGSWFVSARRGYLDILLSFTEDDEEGEESDITYYDSYGRVTHVMGERHNWSLNYLLANDKFVESENEDGDVEDTTANYDDLYLWTKVSSAWSDRLSSESLLFWGDQSQDRIATSVGGFEAYDLKDDRSLIWWGVKQDWQYSVNDDHMISFGWAFRDVDAAYDYRGVTENDPPVGGGQAFSLIETKLDPTGEETSAWLAHRWRINPRLYTETGVRFDRQTLVEDDQVSPRFSLFFEQNERTSWRFAYGTYYQAERAHELEIADGEKHFQTPERATHWLVGLDHRFANGLDFRVEGYLKDLSDLRTRYDNLTRSMVQYAGPSADRIALDVDTGEVRGVEFVLKQNLGGKYSWFLNYAWSEAQDDYQGGKVARQFDQEHTLNASFNWRPGPKWNFNVAWIYHTGWRTTPIRVGFDEDGTPELVAGDIFSETLPDYHRMDLRINRRVQVGQKRAFELFLDISNLYNRTNVRGYSDWTIQQQADGSLAAVALETEDWLPILPTFGFTWKF
ncbi:TonB-dependent receptor [Acanthopleuribacter pedis]|uniref:Carboxypeptidase regulatory-like domain-containing protein n=1 Tax=Acanthopleuribacter pedis TaxID=442870 RepID=A0A8J7U3P7_9BACT|nr:carboxypeptidase regulatory-like domain-containing protein [Acanthopleuribacter pedis]MBO1319832.1 carboxypeptidase regulatory-like domain-containing protein [Acanthopleuribacter pedis]